MLSRNGKILLAFLTLGILRVDGNYSSERCPIHCSAQRPHPCPGEDGTQAGVPIPEVAGGLDKDGNCRPQDHGKFLYTYVTNESGRRQCVKCYCFQDSSQFELIDPSCYKVSNEVCVGLGVSNPGPDIRQDPPQGRGDVVPSVSSKGGSRLREQLKSCLYFGVDCNPMFFLK